MRALWFGGGGRNYDAGYNEIISAKTQENSYMSNLSQSLEDIAYFI